jgi:RHS repeat-associated protein
MTASICGVVAKPLAAHASKVTQAQAPSSSDWPMFHHDAAHTGESALSIGSVADYGDIWQEKIGSSTKSSGVSSSAVVSGGVVYAGGSDGTLTAYNSSGGTVWSKSLGSTPITDTPAVDGTSIFVEDGGILYALKTSNGSQIWNKSIGNNQSSPSVANGQIFIAPETGDVQESYNETNGKLLWTGTLASGEATYNSPTVGGTLVYTGDTSCSVNALNVSSGQQAWAANYDSENIDATVAYTGSTVVGGSTGSYAFSRDALTGASQWQTSVDGPVESSPAIFQPSSGDPIVTFGTDSGSMYGLDEVTGAVLWRTPVYGDVFSSPAVSADGIAFVGTEAGAMVALNVETGAVLWSYEVGSAVTSSPAITSAGVYVIGSDGNLYLFGHGGKHLMAPEFATGIGQGEAARYGTGCTHGDPINCASGDYWESLTDVKLSEPGPSLDLTRTYNSLFASTSGMFGYGWTSTYESHLTVNGDGSITVTESDGSQVTATPSGGSGYSVPSWADSTLVLNGDGTYSFDRQHLDTYVYSSSGQLLSITDQNGYKTSFSYNGSGQLTQVSDVFGNLVNLTWGSNGLVSSVVDPMGRTTTYSYDSAGDLTGQVDPAGRTMSFKYDSNHYLVSLTDPNGGVVTNVYDSSGRVTSQTDGAGLTTTYAYTGDNYSAAGGNTTITDPHGNVEIENYQYGTLQSLTKAAGTSDSGTWSYTYDPNSLGVASVTDPNGNQTSTTYDAQGNVLTTTDPLDNTTSYTYNSLNEVLTKTDPLGNVTTNTYDSDGNVLTTTDPLGKTTTYSYQDSSLPGQPTAITNPDGHETQLVYDNSTGQLASSTTSAAAGKTEVTNYAYDVDGDLICQVSPDESAAGVICPSNGSYQAGTIASTYDNDDELTSQTNADGDVTSYTYDADGNLLTTTDAAGNVTKSTYDGDDRVLTTTTGFGTSTPSTATNGYDIKVGSGKCASVSDATYCTTSTDPNSQVSVSYFNSRDELIETNQPGGIDSSYTYDPAGNQVSETDAMGRVTYYSYDADSRLESVEYSDGVTPDVSYQYDSDGNRTSMSDGTGTTSYSYDADSRLVSETNGSGATVDYIYDSAGNVTGITYPNGQQVQQTYDGAGRLTSVTDWNGSTTTFSYDADGNVTSTQYPNGDSIASTYNNEDQPLSDSLSSTSPGSNATLSYSRNGDGLVTQESTSGALTGTDSYGYDAKNELTSANTSAYSYDADGNPVGFASSTQSFNNADELTRATGSTSGKISFAYNADGGRTSATSSKFNASYQYDQAGNLTSAVVTPTPSGGAAETVQAKDQVAANKPKGPTPYIYQVQPNYGPASGGTKVTISGVNFTGAKTVKFGKKAAKFKVTDDSTITATSPAGKQPTDVRITNKNGTSPENGNDVFSYTKAPGVYSLSPSGGVSDGGNSIVITGFNFTHVKAVKFGSVSTKNFKVTSRTQLTAVVPAASSSSELTVDVTVTSQSGTSEQVSADQYSYSPSYTYNGDGLLMTGDSNNQSVPLVWNTQTTIPEILQSGSTYLVYGPNDLPIEQVSGSATQYFVHDSLGSTRALVSSSGGVDGTFTYSAYGIPTESSGTTTTAMLFAGYFYDQHSGLYYLQHRFYDPNTGLFLSVDPIVEVTEKPYSYSNDDPINTSDGSGLWGWNPIRDLEQAISSWQFVDRIFSSAGGHSSDQLSDCNNEYAGYGSSATTYGYNQGGGSSEWGAWGDAFGAGYGIATSADSTPEWLGETGDALDGASAIYTIHEISNRANQIQADANEDLNNPYSGISPDSEQYYNDQINGYLNYAQDEANPLGSNIF